MTNTNRITEIRYYYFLLFAWLASVFVYSLNSILGLSVFNNIILIASSLIYLVLFYRPRDGIGIVSILLLYFFLRMLILLFVCLDDDFLYNITFIGDADGYHIPFILSLTNDNYLDYLFDYQSYSFITGKVTHIIYAFFYYLYGAFFIIGSKEDIFRSIILIVYVVNTAMLILASLYLYFSMRKLYIEEKYIVFAISLIVFSPFILTWSSYVVKETIHVVLIIIIFVAILKKQYYILMICAVIFFIDRMYMLYLLIFITLLSNSFNKITILLFLLAVTSLALTVLPIDNYINQYGHIGLQYADAGERGDSLVGKSNIAIDFIRIIFSPFFVSAFKERYLDFNIFFREHLTVGVLLTYFIFKFIAMESNKFKTLMFLILLFHLILFPDGARQKITVMIPFFAIYYSIYLHSVRNGIEFNKFWKI